MPLPKELLDKIRGDLDKMEASYATQVEVMEDAREAGYDVTKSEELLLGLKVKLERAKKFYELQVAKLPPE